MARIWKMKLISAMSFDTDSLNHFRLFFKLYWFAASYKNWYISSKLHTARSKMIFINCTLLHQIVMGDFISVFGTIFSFDQTVLRIRLSVYLFVRPSDFTLFFQCSCHCIIMKFSWVITIDKRDVHAKGQVQRSKVKVTEVKPNLAVSGP